MSAFTTPDPYTYHSSFPSYHSSEAHANTLPVGRNNPQIPPHGLYAEKLSGTSFTTPRASNRQSWLYRILPSASHSTFTPLPSHTHIYHNLPNQLRWDPFDFPASNPDFVEGIHVLAGVGTPALKEGLQICVYTATRSMDANTAYYCADGDLLIVPQTGDLDVRTEFGRMYVRPLEILVVPRGVRFHVGVTDQVRGYMLETYSAGHWELPELGPMGSNALANPRDFQVPRADYVDDGDGDGEGGEYRVVAKMDGKLYTATQNHSPFDVVAWHGNYYPMKYDLGRFNTMGTISYDHPDPSIFTVLTLPTAIPGTAAADFVIFPPRWLVGEDTFRPPWYHRNIMSEFMGLIKGGYDAKTAGGFVPGGASLHNVMAGHGPDAETAEKASACDLKPQKVGEGSMAFMFESVYMIGVTEWARARVQEAYEAESWGKVKRRFVKP